MALIHFYIKLLIIQKIICQCYERCEKCNSGGNSNDQKCIKCKSNYYLMENRNNCYYLYEKPTYYFDTDSQQLKVCPFPCYECSGNAINNCISCQRGYYYNEGQCTLCSSDVYIYIMDGTEKCQNNNNENKNFFCELKITTCSNININEDYECPREYPLLNLNSEKKECVLEYYTNSNDYKISNQIIKTQFLNNIIHIEGEGAYISLCNNDNEDLIIESNRFSSLTKSERYFFGIKKNGRPLFYKQESHNYNYQKTINFIDNNSFVKYDSQLIRIKLFNDDEEKEYYLSCSNNLYYTLPLSIEINDINENIITGISKSVFFEREWSNIYFALFELKSERNVYLLGYNEKQSDGYFYIIFQKVKFYKSKISEENSFE